MSNFDICDVHIAIGCEHGDIGDLSLAVWNGDPHFDEVLWSDISRWEVGARSSRLCQDVCQSVTIRVSDDGADLLDALGEFI